MDLYGQQSKSIPQKIVIHALEILFIGASYWILFKNGGDFIAKLFHITNAADALTRRTILFTFHIIVFLRLALTMFYLLKRKIPWEESISVPMAFALYYIGFSIFILPTHQRIDAIDYISIFIFLAGSFTNTYAEILRHIWKKNPAHKGKIYTGGLFKYAMHINYFGDLLWVSGYALLTRNWYAIIIPVFLFCFFAFYNIPKLDAHLRQHYGAGFEAYAAKTKKLIPFIY